MTNGKQSFFHERGHTFPKIAFLKSSYEAKIPEKCASDKIFSYCSFINNSSISRNFSLKYMYHLREWNQQKKFVLSFLVAMTNGKQSFFHERGHTFPKIAFLKSSYEAKIPEKCASDKIFSYCSFINNSSISRNFSLKYMYHLREWNQQKKIYISCVVMPF